MLVNDVVKGLSHKQPPASLVPQILTLRSRPNISPKANLPKPRASELPKYSVAIYPSEKSTFQTWDFIGSNGMIPRVFDKFSKSFVITLSDSDSKLKYPWANFKEGGHSPSNSLSMSGSNSQAFGQSSNNFRSASLMNQAILFQIMIPENEQFVLEFVVSDIHRVRVLADIYRSSEGWCSRHKPMRCNSKRISC